MPNSFEYAYEDEHGTKTFELTYDFTPGEREVRWGDNAHPAWPAEVDIYDASCIEIDEIPVLLESRKDLGKWFLGLLNHDKALRERIEEMILEDLEARSQERFEE